MHTQLHQELTPSAINCQASPKCALPVTVLDRGCDLPLYVQLFEAIAWYVESGQFSANSKLPSVRRIATDLCVSTETVCKAMDLLLSNGFIETRSRRSAVVSTMWLERQAYMLPKPL